jgi:hypothetical protein
MNDYFRLFLMGGGFGLICAVVGAMIDYLLMRRQGEDEEFVLPGCMLLMIGALGLLGLVAIGVAFMTTGTIWPAVSTGVGVLLGFLAGFTIIFLTAIFFSDRKVDSLE